jgi:hypothetical protein
LDYAETVSGAKRYGHVALLNSWLVALLDGRLYFDGPGPEAVPSADGELDDEGRPLLVHPTRGVGIGRCLIWLFLCRLVMVKVFW